MFEYEMYRLRQADLVRVAERHRLVRAARQALRTAGGTPGDEMAARVSGPSPRRSRFTRAA
jgi:hypothetical protein